jgi:nucleolar protein TMA23
MVSHNDRGWLSSAPSAKTYGADMWTHSNFAGTTSSAPQTSHQPSQLCMDAANYLRSHGWRGLGYSLDSNDRGMKRPLPINKKANRLGVGKNPHAAQIDQWWLKALDESLKQIGTGKPTALKDAVKNKGVDKAGLYRFFVKGDGLEGTISDSTTSTSQCMTRDVSATPTLDGSAPLVAGGHQFIRTNGIQLNKKKKRPRDEVPGDELKTVDQRRDEGVKKRKRTKAPSSGEPALQDAPGSNTVPLNGSTLSERKRKRYAAKAEARGMTFEAYVAKRNRRRQKRP